MDISRHIRQLIKAELGRPFELLGPHATKDSIIVRAFLPDAKTVRLIHEQHGREYPMQRVHKDGLFEVSVGLKRLFRYKIRTIDESGTEREFHDPYAFAQVLTDFDLHLIGEGTHYKNYEKLGSHVRTVEGVKGVHFAVWAPNAKSVGVVGEFNSWDNRRHPMRSLGSSGIWEIFIPELGEGTSYKYEIKSKLNKYHEFKADPFSFCFEVRPNSASVVYDIEDKHEWGDAGWMESRARKNWLKSPVSVYEVHLGSWMRDIGKGCWFLTYRELAERLIPYVKETGFTHIELLPVMEHPFDASWGYQTIGYYAPTSRFGEPADFMYFVDACHQNGIGVIADWVPAHFPKDAHGLGFFDGTCLYEHADPRQGEHMDWGTLVFNYGRNEVRNYLISNALFWLDKYHIDGLRVDAVASMIYLDYSREPGQWVPNKYGGNENLEAIDFVKKFNEVVHHYHPGVLTIAEESTSWSGVSRPTYLGGLGFSMKWNMGWMHDTLNFFSKDPVHRKFHANSLTFSMLYAFTENFMLPFSHDEVVYGKKSMLSKMPGDMWQRFASLRALYGYFYGHPGKKLMFMGGEFGQWDEWNFDEGLQLHLLQYEQHAKLKRYVADLNTVYRTEAALHQIDYDWRGFGWIDFRDADSSVLSFIRKAGNEDDFLIFVLNLTPVPRYGYRIGVPMGGYYRELLNSDSGIYWGSNVGNGGGVNADDAGMHGMRHSIELVLPPLSCLILKPS